MKSLKLAVFVSAVMLSVAGLAQAETSNGNEESATRLNQKFKSKRPYQAPVDLKKSNIQAEKVEGAASVQNNEESVDSKKAYNQKRLKANKTSRRHQ